jgi:bifunctional non-homologous end joining protein LigD
MKELMLCESADENKLDDPGYAAELKADGTHIRINKEEKIRIFGRPKDDGTIPEYTNRLTEITEAGDAISARSFEIVGEAVVFNEDGRTWFEGSQRRCSTQDPAKQRLYKAKYPVVLLAFDITELDGRDITQMPWEQRKELLQGLLEESAQDPIQYLPHTEDRRGFFEEVTLRGEEGVILKRFGSPYMRTRSTDWLKVKKWYHERCLVVGYTEGKPGGKREDFFGSLILAQPNDSGVLQYAGKVGTGFNDAEVKHIYKQLKAAEIDVRPVSTKDPYTPVKLDLEVTVKFYETSKNGVFRFPSMLKDQQGNNMIHYGQRTVKAVKQQLSLKDLLAGVKA